MEGAAFSQGFVLHWAVRIASFNGEVAAGKTTLIRRLIAFLTECNVKAIECKEPVDKWELIDALACMYVDMNKMLASPPAEGNGDVAIFQMLAFATRIAAYMTALREANAYAEEVTRGMPVDPMKCVVVVVLERSPWTDRHVFKKLGVECGLWTPFKSAAYDMCHDDWVVANQPPTPHLEIFVDTSIATGMARAAERDRKSERSLSIDWQSALWEKHQELFKRQTAFMGAPIMTVKGERDFRDDDTILAKIATKFCIRIGMELKRSTTRSPPASEQAIVV
jgi:thymidylate kinase